MGRQFRAPRRGSSEAFVAPISGTLVGSSLANVVSIPNYGITDITTITAVDIVLDAPETGVQKKIICSASAAVARVVKFSTGGTVSCGTLATTAGTQVTMQATVDMCLSLIGRNSTHWVIESVYPASTVAINQGVLLAGS
jgi:hypothetical protein